MPRKRHETHIHVDPVSCEISSLHDSDTAWPPGDDWPEPNFPLDELAKFLVDAGMADSGVRKIATIALGMLTHEQLMVAVRAACDADDNANAPATHEILSRQLGPQVMLDILAEARDASDLGIAKAAVSLDKRSPNSTLMDYLVEVGIVDESEFSRAKSRSETARARYQNR